MRSVPDQLKNETFIVMTGHDCKKPVHAWSNPSFRFTAEKLQSWLDAGFNYSVIYTTDICVMDADNAERLTEIGVLEYLPETFTVMSGRNDSVGLHLYFKMDDGPEKGTKIYMNDPETGESLGDFRLPLSPFYNVGPSCIHVSGKPYKILRDIPIAKLSYTRLIEALEPTDWKLAGAEMKKEFIPRTPVPHSLDEFNLSVIDFLMPANAKLRNDEFIGEHPVHGSTTGSNLTVKSDGSVWYCRRHGTGGNWVDALAVSEGIIDCEDVGRQYTREQWNQIKTKLRQLNPEVYTKWDEYSWLRRQKKKTEAHLHQQQGVTIP